MESFGIFGVIVGKMPSTIKLHVRCIITPFIHCPFCKHTVSFLTIRLEEEIIGKTVRRYIA
jgi:hypothetical protein